MSDDSPAVLLKTKNSTAVLNKYIPGVIEFSLYDKAVLAICLFQFDDLRKNDCFICFIWLNEKLYYDNGPLKINFNKLQENPINSWADVKNIIKNYIEYYINYYQTEGAPGRNRIAILQYKLARLNQCS